MTLRHYVKGRQERANTATPIAETYFCLTDEQTDDAYYSGNSKKLTKQAISTDEVLDLQDCMVQSC